MCTSIALTGNWGFMGLRSSILKKVFPHDKCSEAICQSIHPESWLSSAICVRPNNVKSTVDKRSDNAMHGRVDQGQICKVVGMGDLKFSQRSSTTLGSPWFTSLRIAFKISKGKSRSCNGPSCLLGNDFCLSCKYLRILVSGLSILFPKLSQD